MQDNKTHSLHGISRAVTTRRKSSVVGFTIVELLIVIVVIGILAAITIVAYNGIQSRARDTQRTSDMAAIMKALELYKIDYGEYPPSSNGASIWNDSTHTTWMQALVDGGYTSTAPVDPINESPYRYNYYVYNDGIGAECTKPLYALRALAYESASNIPSTTTKDLRIACPDASTAFITAGTRAVFSNIKN